jgi:hypothetical protein
MKKLVVRLAIGFADLTLIPVKPPQGDFLCLKDVQRWQASQMPLAFGGHSKPERACLATNTVHRY